MTSRSSSLDIWRENVGRRLLNLDFAPATDEPFQAKLNMLWDGLPVVTMQMPSGRMFRDQSLVKDGNDTICIVIPLGHTVNITHGRRELRLGAGEATVLDSAVTGQIGARLPFRMLAVSAPRSAVFTRLDGGAPRLAERIPRSNAALRLLRSYLACVEQAAPIDAMAKAAVCQHLVDLVALSVADQDAKPTESVASSRQTARLIYVIDQIKRRCLEPELSIAALGQEQGVSGRFLQHLLKTSGTSFSERVTEARLAKAHALLVAAGGTKQRVSEVAYACGFGDLSTFNRQFLRKFGTTPSQIRRSH